MLPEAAEHHARTQAGRIIKRTKEPIMKYKTYTVNAAGIEEIRQFLKENHKQ